MAVQKRKARKPHPDFWDEPPARSPLPEYLRKSFIPILLGLFFFIIYAGMMHPGVDAGDSAELQFMSPIWGLCHPPGYAIEVCFGNLFASVPLGSGVAWRINFMMVVAGIVGALALYGTVRRITGLTLAGVAAATTLAFSSIYWSYSLVAEAYVFYAMFLLLAIYFLARFIDTNQAGWLYLGVFCLGVTVADRSSEFLLLPGFLVLYIWARNKVKLTFVRMSLALLILITPLLFSMSYHIIRARPEIRQDRLYSRDAGLRYQILDNDFEPLSAPSFKNRVKNAFFYCLGLTYKSQAQFQPEVVKQDIDKYAWLLSGLGMQGHRYPENDSRNNAQGKGTSIGLLGLILALLGTVWQRRQWGWLTLGWWLFLANTAFILWHHRWDNLTFTIPGLIGLSLLVGMGAAGWESGDKKRRLFTVFCLIVPLFLLITNARHLNRNTLYEKQRLEQLHQLARADFPSGSAIIATYWQAMTYRYLIHIDAGRTDMHILHESPKNWQTLADHFLNNGHPVYLSRQSLNPALLKTLRSHTSNAIWQAGLVKIPPRLPANARP